MDNYNLSFSDSWSVENDVLSGEDVFHNFRDYKPEFTIDQIFQSRDDMVTWVRRVGKENCIVVVIKKSVSLIGGKLPKCILSCERSGKYRSARNAVEGQFSQKNTGTKKYECLFELRGIPIPPAGVLWGVRVECGLHNHETAEYFDGHEYPSRLTPEEKEIVRDMADNTAPREILSVLNKKNPLNTTYAQSIYNLKYTDNIAERDGLSPIQFVLNQLIQKRYLHEYRTNPYTNEITDIVWVHPQNLDLFVNFSSVLVIDVTYKTNEYRLPLLEIVGTTSTMCTYSLMAESAHAKLKLYLGGTMSSLQQAFKKIDKMLKNQFGDIRRSFQRSINIPRHWQIHDELFQQVRTYISLEAMELINVQLQCAEDASYLQFQLRDCTIKITHGLPCKHDLAYYRWYSMPIPIQSIHDHWIKLSMRAPIVNDEGERPNRTYEVIDRLRGMDQSTREHMIDRIIDMTDPSQSTDRGPAYNTAHRGRPTGKEEQSGRRIPSFIEASTSSSRVESRRRGRGDGVRKTQANCVEFSFPSIPTDYIQHLPRAYEHYISHINDVRDDGHCGFRAIAAHIGYGEDCWAQVRRDIINEIEQNKDLYDALYPEIDWADHLIRSLNYFEDSAPDEYWMNAMSMGVVIASAYNLVLHTFDGLPSDCFTHFPLRSPSVPVQELIEIAIARVGNNHFVM
ncbi:uncharacterized protein LOC131321257 [Rhododendron vialii]|uniref:uncharacterized protein LOC131321257 n=1 Tax=Rhododendron vialii TaxID=182163 RepID=UPI00265EC28C|nr:uncharacterized protein LOC131321257 [Rhododendron vialii]